MAARRKWELKFKGASLGLDNLKMRLKTPMKRRKARRFMLKKILRRYAQSPQISQRRIIWDNIKAFAPKGEK